jgi:hypothetical protein
MKMNQWVRRMKMKQQRVERTKLYWNFLVGETTAKVLTGPEGSWEWAGRF